MFKIAVAMITGTIATRLLPGGDDWLAHAAMTAGGWAGAILSAAQHPIRAVPGTRSVENMTRRWSTRTHYLARSSGSGAKPFVTAPIVGATKLAHLDDAVASVNVRLSGDEITTVEEPFVLHAVVDFVWTDPSLVDRRPRWSRLRRVA